jgi:hypothetical protein
MEKPLIKIIKKTQRECPVAQSEPGFVVNATAAFNVSALLVFVLLYIAFRSIRQGATDHCNCSLLC